MLRVRPPGEVATPEEALSLESAYHSFRHFGSGYPAAQRQSLGIEVDRGAKRMH